jgi:hypothetical protein
MGDGRCTYRNISQSDCQAKFRAFGESGLTPYYGNGLCRFFPRQHASASRSPPSYPDVLSGMQESSRIGNQMIQDSYESSRRRPRSQASDDDDDRQPSTASSRPSRRTTSSLDDLGGSARQSNTSAPATDPQAHPSPPRRTSDLNDLAPRGYNSSPFEAMARALPSGRDSGSQRANLPDSCVALTQPQEITSGRGCDFQRGQKMYVTRVKTVETEGCPASIDVEYWDPQGGKFLFESATRLGTAVYTCNAGVTLVRIRR